jgi:hypothetical protein
MSNIVALITTIKPKRYVFSFYPLGTPVSVPAAFSPVSPSFKSRFANQEFGVPKTEWISPNFVPLLLGGESFLINARRKTTILLELGSSLILGR